MSHAFEILHRTATRIAGRVGRHIPYAAQKPFLHLALNEAFREPLKSGEFDFLEGRSIRIRVTDLNIDWLIGSGRSVAGKRPERRIPTRKSTSCFVKSPVIRPLSLMVVIKRGKEISRSSSMMPK